LADVDANIKPVWASLFLKEFLSFEDQFHSGFAFIGPQAL